MDLKRQKNIEYCKKYFEQHREELLQKSRQQYANNIEYYREYSRNYYIKHREHYAEYNKQYREKRKQLKALEKENKICKPLAKKCYFQDIKDDVELSKVNPRVYKCYECSKCQEYIEYRMNKLKPKHC